MVIKCQGYNLSEEKITNEQKRLARITDKIVRVVDKIV